MSDRRCLRCGEDRRLCDCDVALSVNEDTIDAEWRLWNGTFDAALTRLRAQAADLRRLTEAELKQRAESILRFITPEEQA